MIRELHHIIPEVCKITIHEAVTKIRVQKIVRMLGAQNIMDDHKTKRMGSALKFLTRYAQEGDEFLDSIVTGDETRVFHHTSAGHSPFALRKCMTECTSHLAGLWIGAAISNTSHLNKAGSTSKTSTAHR
jgi:hypothetical protein